MRRWCLPAGLIVALAGYFGPWVDHAAAGLVVTGLDLGEYVKFLPPVRSGDIALWRPGFYAPLVAVSIAALTSAYRRSYWPRPWLRPIPITIALVAAFNLVPPAWTPARLVEPEFRAQTATLIVLLCAIAFSPFMALIPRRAAAGLISVVGLAVVYFPLQGFWAVRPAIAALYSTSLGFAWGPWAMVMGLVLTVLAFWFPPPIHPATVQTITVAAPVER